MDLVVEAAAVGGSGYFWVHYLTPAAAVGAVPEVAGAEVVSEVEVSVEVVVALEGALEVEAVSVAAVQVAVGKRFAGLLGTNEFC